MALSAELASLFVSLGVKSTVSDDLDKETSKISTGSKKMSTAAKAGAAGAVAGIAAIAGGVALATNSAVEFESQMSEVFTLLPGITKDAMSEMSADVLEFSTKVGIASDEVVPALYQSISAGVPAENVFDFMEVASQAAMSTSLARSRRPTASPSAAAAPTSCSPTT